MAKIISSRLAKRDDPMFSGGLETFSIRRPKRSLTITPKSTPGETQDASTSQKENSSKSAETSPEAASD